MTIKWKPEEVWTTVLNFSKMEPELARQAYNLGKDVIDWKIKLAQKDLLDGGLDKKKIVPILYRPFDIRFTYYTGRSRGFICRPRPEVMKNMMQDNIGLISPKQFKEQSGAFVTNNIIGHKAVSAYDINYLFPLYAYAEIEKRDLFAHMKEASKNEPNINHRIFDDFYKSYKRRPTPKEIFYYIYALLYSDIFRTKYAEFLKTDFPRIPFTNDFKLFSQMAEYGNRLVELHLLKSKDLENPLARFQGKGDFKVEKVRNEKDRVYINNDQYFEGVKREVWEYQIGGYQVCEKWLKDRKERKLALEDIKHYCKVVTAIEKTIIVQKEIDKIYPKIEENLIAFNIGAK